MQTMPIPDNAIGRVGMLVALQKVKGLPEGRLAIVRHPVGWVKELLHANQHVFAWQVFLTGEPVVIQGNTTQEIIVADKCLLPMSQLESQDITSMVEQFERDSVEAAVAQVRALAKPDAMASPEFDRAMHLAFSEAQLGHAKQVVGVAQVLGEVGFWRSHGGESDMWEWQTVFEGVEIHMSAAPGMFGDWRLSAHAVKSRSWHIPESVALNDWPRGRILKLVLELWESVYGNRRIPVQLELGWMYRQHLRDMQAIQPVMPHVDVEGESWRRALRWLREAYSIDSEFMGPPTDLPVALEIKDGVLRLHTDDHTIGVKLQRGWVDSVKLSLRCLLALLPSAVRGPWIRMEWAGEHAVVNGLPVARYDPPTP